MDPIGSLAWLAASIAYESASTTAREVCDAGIVTLRPVLNADDKNDPDRSLAVPYLVGQVGGVISALSEASILADHAASCAAHVALLLERSTPRAAVESAVMITRSAHNVAFRAFFRGCELARVSIPDSAAEVQKRIDLCCETLDMASMLLDEKPAEKPTAAPTAAN